MSRRSRRQRSRPRRNAPPAPPPPGPPVLEAGGLRASTARAASSERPRRLIERDAPFIASELRRIAMISGVCGSLLVLLVLIDRLR